MLEIVQSSPRMRDVSLSEGGELILRSPLNSEEAMRAYGRLALFQILGAFDKVSSSHTFQTRIGGLQRHVYDLAGEIMEDSRTSSDAGPYYSSNPEKQRPNIRDFGEGLGMARHGRGDINQDYTGLVILEVEHTRELIKPEVVVA